MNDHDAFDARLRNAHAASLEALSPRVQAQLARRRRAALAPPRSSRARTGLGWALGALAACAVAVGMFRPATHEARTPTLAIATPAAPAPDTLEDNPDFYLWLASRDADSLASE